MSLPRPTQENGNLWPVSVRLLEGLALAIAIALIFWNKTAISSDGDVYVTWFAGLGTQSKLPCAGFEIGFCSLSMGLSVLNVPPDDFLSIWSLVIYVLSYLGIRNLVQDRQVRYVLPFLFLALAYFIYLPLSITEHLTRQYVAGAIILFGLGLNRPAYLVLSVVIAGLFHSFALVFLPIAVALWLGFGSFTLIIAFAAALFIDLHVDLLRMLAQIFEQIRLLGEAWDLDYLKSMAHRFNLYWIGFRKPLGYPEVSFRGIIIMLALFAFLKRDDNSIRIVLFILFIATVWYVLRSNDLFAHRIYHYIRELTLLPSTLAIAEAGRISYAYLLKKLDRTQ